MRKLVLLALPLLSVFVSCSGENGISALSELDDMLGMRSAYEKSYLKRMEDLKNMQNGRLPFEDGYNLNARIAEEYRSYSFDSTMAYLNRNSMLAILYDNEEKLTESELGKVAEYIRGGYLVEASNLLNSISPGRITEGLRLDWLRMRHSLAGEMMSYSGGLDLYEAKFSERNRMRDSLMKYIEPGTFEWYELNREAALSARDSVSVRELSRKMLDLTDENSRDYAKACWLYAEGIPKKEYRERLEWLCKSAISDIVCCNKDYAALNDVASLVFDLGYTDRAFHYVSDHCLPDALMFNGRLRTWQVSRFFPPIERAYEQKQRVQNYRMYAAVAFVSLLLVALALLLVYIYRHHAVLARANASLKALNTELAESDKIKEAYITLFLERASDGIDRSRKYNEHLLKYLRKGNYKYVIDEIESLPTLEDDVAQFYKLFDETFLNLYPDFVEQVNALTAEGKSIAVPENGSLVPELRICALIKLGVRDSGKIASLLHYSVNTVYNYKAKLKSRMLCSREKFEETIAGIR